MRILVLGGCGFIGSHVVDAFVEARHDVSVFDRNKDKFRTPIPSVHYHYAEFGNRGELEAVLSAGIDVVIHLVSSTLPQSSNDDPIFDIQTNLIESIVLFELCIKYAVRRLIFVSSGGTVYGVTHESPVSELHPTIPICSYGITKLAIENYLHLFHLEHGLEYVVLRVANPYGERQNPLRKQGVVAVFMHKMLTDTSLDVWGDGQVIRDFVYVEDVARACLVAAESKYVGVCNLGSGTGLSIKELIAKLQAITLKVPNIKWLGNRKFDVPELILDCSKIRNELNWYPTYSLDQGLSKMKNWMLNFISNQ